MEKRTFGKLQLNRETLRNLTAEETGMVVGGCTADTMTGCGSVTCDCTGTCRLCEPDPSVSTC